MSGRIADVALDPTDRNTWYVAVGSGGVWKTVNAGTTWTPIFDGEASYSIGCVTIDPTNPHIDLGRHRRERRRPPRRLRRRRLPQPRRRRELAEPRPEGLPARREDPRAPEEPRRRVRRRAGAAVVEGRRPRALQDDRRREDVDEGASARASGRASPTSRWTRATPTCSTRPRGRGTARSRRYIGGGPESGDPPLDRRRHDLGEAEEGPARGHARQDRPRALAAEPRRRLRGDRAGPAHGRRLPLDRPRLVLGEAVGHGLRRHRPALLPGALRQPARGRPGLPRRRADAGLGGRRQDVPPRRREGQALRQPRDRVPRRRPRLPARRHATAASTRRFDLAKTWRFVANLPVTQFYKIAVDDDAPFYNVYGGTQDNSTQGGPLRTDSGERHHEPRLVRHARSPTATSRRPSPATRTSSTPQWQSGNLVRFDRTTGERVLHPAAARARATRRERFNWDAPILVSPHSPHAALLRVAARVALRRPRRQLAARSRGDLTRDQDRMKLPLMGRQWSWDAAVGPARDVDASTRSPRSPSRRRPRACSTPAPTTASCRSPRTAGRRWRKIEVGTLPGVPASAFVNDVKADLFDAEHRVRRARRPQVRRLPAVPAEEHRPRPDVAVDRRRPAGRHLVWRVVQDHVKPDLLFAGDRVRPLLHARRRRPLDQADRRRAHDRRSATSRSSGARTTSSAARSAAASSSSTTTRRCASSTRTRSRRRPRSSRCARRCGTSSATRSASRARPPRARRSSPRRTRRSARCSRTTSPRSPKSQAKQRQERRSRSSRRGKDTPFPGWDAVEAERREPEAGRRARGERRGRQRRPTRSTARPARASTASRGTCACRPRSAMPARARARRTTRTTTDRRGVLARAGPLHRLARAAGRRPDDASSPGRVPLRGRARCARACCPAPTPRSRGASPRASPRRSARRRRRHRPSRQARSVSMRCARPSRARVRCRTASTPSCTPSTRSCTRSTRRSGQPLPGDDRGRRPDHDHAPRAAPRRWRGLAPTGRPRPTAAASRSPRRSSRRCASGSTPCSASACRRSRSGSRTPARRGPRDRPVPPLP